MSKSVTGSMLLLILGIPAAILVMTVILGYVTGCPPVAVVIGLVFLGWFYVSGLPDEKDAGKTFYVTDWKGNSSIRHGKMFVPFRTNLFKFREFTPRVRTTSQIRHVGTSKLNLTIHWRPNLNQLDQFTKGSDNRGSEKVLEDYLILRFVDQLHEEYGIFWECPKKVQKFDEIRDDNLGIIISYRSAERTEPLPEPEPEEEWLKYSALHIGTDDKEPIFLDEDDLAAHVHIIGASRHGKTKLIEYVARQIIHDNKEGLCVIDPNQQLYDDLLTWCISRKYINENIFFFDPSDEKSTIGFNPFTLRGKATPERVAARANRLLHTTLKALGISGDSAIQAQRIIRCMYYAIIEQNLPVTELEAFFTERLFDRRDEIMSRCKSQSIRDQWEMLTSDKDIKSYNTMMHSSANRLFEFISEGGVKKIFTNPQPLDFAEITKRGKAVIINLNKNDFLPIAARNIVGTFLVDEIWEVMSSRSREQLQGIPRFNLMVDEFQNFATPEFATMLKEGAKYRLHLWLINHVLSDLDRDVRNALNACRTRIAFGGTLEKDAPFVLEGSWAREDRELRDDIHLIPRLQPRRFMLRRQGMKNIICDTPYVKSFPVDKSLKELCLNAFARRPGEKSPQPTQAESTPALAKKDDEAVSKSQEKGGEIPTDDLYY